MVNTNPKQIVRNIIGGTSSTRRQPVRRKLRQGNVSESKIIGYGKNLYLVCWSRIANFGYNLMRGNSEKEVFENHLFSPNKEVNFIIVKISEKDLPVIFKQYGN